LALTRHRRARCAKIIGGSPEPETDESPAAAIFVLKFIGRVLGTGELCKPAAQGSIP
jgi:hypothetical protein